MRPANSPAPDLLSDAASEVSVSPVLNTRFLYVLSIPIAAGVASFGDIRIAGMAYTGWLWFSLLLAGVVLLQVEGAVARDLRGYLPVRLWLLWLAYLWASLAWCGGAGGRNIQEALQISMPVLVAVAASEFVRSEDQLRILLRTFGLILLPLAFCAIAHRVGLLGDPEEQGNRVLALSAAVTGCVFLAAGPPRYVLSFLGWVACLGTAFITGSRMATLALLVAPLFHPLYRSVVVRASIAAVLAVLGIAIFYSRTFQERFFASGAGTLADMARGEFLDFGRFDVWPVVYEEIQRNPVLGNGVGSIFSFVPTVWPEMRYVHNDYLRIAYELGIVGLGLFLVVLLWQLFDLRRRIRRSEGVVRCTYAAAYLGLVLFAIIALTDNPLIYNIWYTNPLFAIMGAAYGVDAHTARASETPLAHSPLTRGEQ